MLTFGLNLESFVLVLSSLGEVALWKILGVSHVTMPSGQDRQWGMIHLSATFEMAAQS